jgi:hypothetical protein
MFQTLLRRSDLAPRSSAVWIRDKETRQTCQEAWRVLPYLESLRTTLHTINRLFITKNQTSRSSEALSRAQTSRLKLFPVPGYQQGFPATQGSLGAPSSAVWLRDNLKPPVPVRICGVGTAPSSLFMHQSPISHRISNYPSLSQLPRFCKTCSTIRL